MNVVSMKSKVDDAIFYKEYHSRLDKLEGILRDKIFTEQRKFFNRIARDISISSVNDSGAIYRVRSRNILVVHYRAVVLAMTRLFYNQGESVSKGLIENLISRVKASKWIYNNALENSKTTTATLTGRARKIISGGYLAGLGENAIGKLLRLAGFENGLSGIVARMETSRAADRAQYEAIIAKKKKPKTKTWVNRRDDRVRNTHNRVTGEDGLTSDVEGIGDEAVNIPTVGFRENFIVGGYKAQRPRDENLPPNEIFGCRCFVRYNY